MATRRRPAAPPAPEPNDELVDERDDDERDERGDETDDLDLAMEQLTGEAEYIVLWRTDGTTGKQEHVDKVALSRFTAEYVRERHGGGDYMLRAYGPKLRGGRRGVKKYKEFSIDKSLPPKSGSAVSVWKDRYGSTAIVPTMSSDTRREMPEWVRDMLAASVPVLLGAIVTNLTREKTADPLLVELIRSNGKGNGADPVELQRLLADERARAIDLGKQMAGGAKRRDGGDDDGMFAVIGQGIETLQEFAAGYRINAETEAKKATAPTSSAAQLMVRGDRDPGAMDHNVTDSNGASSTDGAPTTTGAGGLVRPWVEAAAPYMGMLPLAKKLKPETAAAMISDNLDDDQFGDLMADIEDETGGGVLTRIPGYFPALANVNTDWFRAVIDAVAASADPEEDEPPAATPASSETEPDGKV